MENSLQKLQRLNILESKNDAKNKAKLLKNFGT